MQYLPVNEGERRGGENEKGNSDGSPSQTEKQGRLDQEKESTGWGNTKLVQGEGVLTTAKGLSSFSKKKGGGGGGGGKAQRCNGPHRRVLTTSGAGTGQGHQRWQERFKGMGLL